MSLGSMARGMGEQIVQSRNRQRFFDGTAAPLMTPGKETSVHVRSCHNHMPGKVRCFKAVDEQIPISVRMAGNRRLAKSYRQVDGPPGVQSS